MQRTGRRLHGQVPRCNRQAGAGRSRACLSPSIVSWPARDARDGAMGPSLFQVFHSRGGCFHTLKCTTRGSPSERQMSTSCPESAAPCSSAHSASADRLMTLLWPCGREGANQRPRS